MEVKSSTLQITFDLIPGQPCEGDERYTFWNDPKTAIWFKKRGYTLYKSLGYGGRSRPVLPCEPYQEANHPWPFYDTDFCDDGDKEGPLLASDFEGKIVFAQDSLNRHVVIKLVRAHTDEYRILKFLSEQSLKTLEDNCVVPVLELLPTEGYWFAVMPRWSSDVQCPPFGYLMEVIDIMRSFLKGIVFLHNNNICHGDIALRNILVNHFADERGISSNTTRWTLRNRRLLTYALFDFDHSAMFPPNADKSELRLPYQRSWGNFNTVTDTDAGEFDYDPFAFDVGCLGVMFRSYYRYLIPLFHGLAPLIDMMSTWDIRRRFTAVQALEFFEARVSEISEAQMTSEISTLRYADRSLDPWNGLPADFVERWKMYKATPPPLTRRLLFWITNRRWMCHIVPWTRWLCFQTFLALPLRIYNRLCSGRIAL